MQRRSVIMRVGLVSASLALLAACEQFLRTEPTLCQLTRMTSAVAPLRDAGGGVLGEARLALVEQRNRLGARETHWQLLLDVIGPSGRGGPLQGRVDTVRFVDSQRRIGFERATTRGSDPYIVAPFYPGVPDSASAERYRRLLLAPGGAFELSLNGITRELLLAPATASETPLQRIYCG